MHAANLLLLAGALGAAAHPSGHAHNHQAHHDKRAPGFFKAIHKPHPSPTTSTPPAAATTSSAAPKSTASSGSGASAYVEFCSGKSKRASTANIDYVGDTGTAGHWGCNIMLVEESIASLYTYTMVFTNVASESYEVICFNKIGADGKLDGFFSAGAVTFNLAAGGKQTVAFDANSQGACAWGPGSVPRTSVGELGGSWAEFDFGDQANSGWSGADCSSLVSASAGLSIPGCQLCFDGTCSTILPGGQGTNAFVAGTEYEDGLGLNIPGGGKISIQASVGYH